MEDVLKTRIKLLEESIVFKKRQLKNSQDQLDNLKNCKQPKTEDLYKGIENYFTVKNEAGKYEFILGGDGRSSAWSEQRSGKISTITLNKGVYLNVLQEKIVVEYVKEKYKSDKVIL
tara:strand:- start:1244 stop:1594 length:351 start_codon:yes stop_codon:yes gene_type:complete